MLEYLTSQEVLPSYDRQFLRAEDTSRIDGLWVGSQVCTIQEGKLCRWHSYGYVDKSPQPVPEMVPAPLIAVFLQDNGSYVTVLGYDGRQYGTSDWAKWYLVRWRLRLECFFG